MTAQKRLFLIDGSALAYRSYFAFIRNPLYTSKGENTSAIYGFTISLLQLLREEHPEFLAVVFDTPEPTFRHVKYREYKATREKMPDEMASQLPRIREVVEALNIPIVEVPGYEADDVMGTLAKQAEARGIETLLVTGDKDFMQLVSDLIRIYSLRKNGEEREILDPAGVKKKLGVPPEQVIEVLALMGDTSDNIPGVPQIGEKTAVKLITTYGSVEEVLAHAKDISQNRVSTNLQIYSDRALLSKELVTIHTTVPLEIDFQQLQVGTANTERLQTLFRELEFATLLGETATNAEQDDHRYHTITTKEDLEAFLSQLSQVSRFVFDVETTHLDPLQAEIVGFAFAFVPREAYYIPVPFPEQGDTEGATSPGENENLPYVLERLKPILGNPAIQKAGQNLKYDLLVLSRYQIPVQGIDFDTMVASYVLNPSGRQHNLDALALEYLKFQKTPITALIGSGKQQKTMREVPLETISCYACEDADITLRLRTILEPKLRETETLALFQQVEIPLITVLAEMEKTGVRLDLPLLQEMSQTFAARLEGLSQEIFALAGEEFNINSTQQLGAILFEKLEIQKELGIKKIKKTKTGYATDVQVLEQLKAHPLVQKILDYRQMTKLKSTYIDALPKLINPFTGRVHTSFNQTVTATGRLSSSNPNLQNIPVRTEMGREIRKAFIPDSSHLFLSADYSQIELRIMAHLSQDKSLLEAFQQGADIHRQTAAKIFGIDPEEVTAEQRHKAKSINFGIIYGMGAYRLATEIDITPAEAEHFIASYFENYPGVYHYIASTIEQAQERGYVTTLLNRRRYLPELQSDNQRVRNTAEKIAINTPIQGTAADIIKIAMITIHKNLRTEKMATKMLLQVHDELVFEVPKHEQEQATKIIKDAMESAIQLDVPIKVDIGLGENWLEAH